MNEFKMIVAMNEAMIKLQKDKNQNNEKNLKINEYLKDEAIFFKISKENAYKILESVGVQKSQLERVYKKLISVDMFFELEKKGKLNADDENLTIKYKNYDNKKMFKK